MSVAALTANRSVELLERQARRFRPELTVAADETAASDLRVRLADTDIRVASGQEGLLEAAALGVGCCWVMHFNPAAVREEFALPDNLEPVAILTMGYPAQDAAPYPGHSESQPIEDLVTVL